MKRKKAESITVSTQTDSFGEKGRKLFPSQAESEMGFSRGKKSLPKFGQDMIVVFWIKISHEKSTI